MLGLALLAGSAAPLGAEEREPRAPWLEALDRYAGDVISPRALARAHAELEGLSRCSQCHDGLRETPDERCLVCHEDVAGRMQQKSGWHGQLEGPCSACHGEHRGVEADLLGLDRKTWNHELASFPLRGAHAEVECDECHRRAGENGVIGFHAQGIAFERCADCHEDVHGAEFLAERDCGECHTERGFRADALRADAFDHTRDAGFALEGAHSRVACGECHPFQPKSDVRPPASGAPRECAGCHEDPHAGALDRGREASGLGLCTSCHTPASWAADGEGARFDHGADTEFPLDALHARLDCAACHDGLSFRAAGRDCADCHRDAAALLAGDAGGVHAAADPHASATSCRDCHAANVVAPKLIDYERACLACHPVPYGSLLVSRKRIVDEGVVAVEAALRKRELARERGEPGSTPVDAALAASLARIAKSGMHNPALSEAALLALLESLRAGEAAQ